MNNGRLRNGLKILTLAALLALLLSTTAPAQQKSSIQTPADPKATQKLDLETLNIETFKSKRAEVETAKDLAEPARKEALDLLDRTIRFLEDAHRLTAEGEILTRQVASAPDRIKEIKDALGKKDPELDTGPELEAAPEMKTEALEQRVREEKAALATARTTLSSRRDQIEKLKTRPPQLQKEIADAKRRVEALQKELAGIHPGGEFLVLDEARQSALIAERARHLASIRLNEQELLNYEGLISLMTAEWDLASFEAAWREAKAKAWQEAAQKRRQLEAIGARMDAEVAKKLATDLPKAVKEQYDTNITLGKELETVTAGEAQTSRELDRRQSELKLLERDFTQARQLLQNKYLSESMGLSLRRHRQDLPNPKTFKHSFGSVLDRQSSQLVAGSDGSKGFFPTRTDCLDPGFDPFRRTAFRQKLGKTQPV